MAKTAKKESDNQVRVHRQIAGMTQAELAKAVEISRQTVVAIEAGGYAPSVYLALRLADVLEATVEELFVSDKKPPPTIPTSKETER